MSELKAPFPYYGGKSKVSKLVWQRFGDVKNYVEPFAGSMAVLLGRPLVESASLPKETVNDKDGFISNFWRAVQSAPDEVAQWADWPPNENDLHARHSWLVQQADGLMARLEGNPDYYDAKIAGWWVWGIALWIGSGWCSGNGPWQQVEMEDGTRQLVNVGNVKNGLGISRQLMHAVTGKGIQREELHVGDNGQGINRKRIQLGNMGSGQGVHSGVVRQRIQVGNDGKGQGVTAVSDLQSYMRALQARLRRVRVCSGDWSRVMGPSVTTKHGLTAVFLDPPYNAEAKRQSDLYRMDDEDIAHDVRAWAIENGDDPLFRIALCGYEHEHGAYMPDSWECVAWNAGKGYAGQNKKTDNDNGATERIWFSPHCVKQAPKIQQGLLPIIIKEAS